MEYQGFPTPEEQLARETSEPDLFRALLFGLVAGALGGAIWFAIVVATQHEVGIVAVGVGWLVGIAVVLGSRRKGGMRLQVLSVLIALAAMAGAEYFIVRHFVVAYVVETRGAETAATIPLFLPLDVALDFVVGAIQDDPAELLFWAIALFAAFRTPAVKLVPVPKPAPTTPA